MELRYSVWHVIVLSCVVWCMLGGSSKGGVWDSLIYQPSKRRQTKTDDGLHRSLNRIENKSDEKRVGK